MPQLSLEKRNRNVNGWRQDAVKASLHRLTENITLWSSVRKHHHAKFNSGGALTPPPPISSIKKTSISPDRCSSPQPRGLALFLDTFGTNSAATSRPSPHEVVSHRGGEGCKSISAVREHGSTTHEYMDVTAGFKELQRWNQVSEDVGSTVTKHPLNSSILLSCERDIRQPGACWSGVSSARQAELPPPWREGGREGGEDGVSTETPRTSR
ncbi:hypothetical protein EYF80_032224 [Liparis tanakae]|uniref:Uncharacterized protein n=1 Tax=Liparis tanakae TaxID=230148 RepID=A0A4Z2GVH2_9TELE|nr:hypothetical protein EYF80_032224 [Liparis tanakae]